MLWPDSDSYPSASAPAPDRVATGSHNLRLNRVRHLQDGGPTLPLPVGCSPHNCTFLHIDTACPAGT